jgi:hypothetical protein
MLLNINSNWIHRTAKRLLASTTSLNSQDGEALVKRVDLEKY